MFSTLRRYRHVLSVLALGMVVSISAVDFAEARRAGGGSSFGSRGTRTYSAPPSTTTAPTTAAPIQRSMTPNNQATNPGTAAGAQAAAQPRRGLFGGFGGGILGGLFLGGMFGMLMGNGFGGMAGMFGMLFQMLLIGGLIFLAMRFFARRQQPAASGPAGGLGRYDSQAPQGNNFGGFKIPQMGSLGGSAAAAHEKPRVASARTDEIGINNRDFDQFEKLLTDVQTAYGAEDYARIRAISTPEAMSYLAEELGENATNGQRNEVKDVQLLQGDLSEAWRENGLEYATVAMRYQSIDVMVDRDTGKVISGDPAQPTEATEIWTFVRKGGENWKLSAIQGVN
jgi:predicted lipid-binding transport protein (Tim44 family)